MSFPFPRPFPGPSNNAGLSAAASALLLISTEPSAFALDFMSDTYALRTITNEELLLAQLGDVWDGLAIDFTTNLYANRLSEPAETLLGPGPELVENGFGIDFPSNTYALRN